MSTLPPEPPSTPGYPAGPETSQSLGTDVLERTEERKAPGDDERYAHYVRKDRITESAVLGQPVVALCGKVWTPTRNPDRYPVCPICKEIFAQMGKGGSGWPFGPDVPGSSK
ncbi:DUF3039 domain-containing protein [Arcanobacterium haemolyticum]|nr:DUF3039 domain-containing protein [Arcanobacterium haemolyticum]